MRVVEPRICKGDGGFGRSTEGMLGAEWSGADFGCWTERVFDHQMSPATPGGRYPTRWIRAGFGMFVRSNAAASPLFTHRTLPLRRAVSGLSYE